MLLLHEYSLEGVYVCLRALQAAQCGVKLARGGAVFVVGDQAVRDCHLQAP